MVTLVSPGVDVEITDNSFYTSAGPGTVPLIVFATQANKADPTTTGALAAGTIPANAGQLYNITSQRELIQTFGNPYFDSVQGTTVYGSETNEYGLHAAYQYLGISNSIYALRADIDLSQLEANDDAPVGAPVNGTMWLDTANTSWGLLQSNGNASDTTTYYGFATKTVTVYGNSAQLDNNNYPLATLGQTGDFGIVTAVSPFMVYENIASSNANAWYPIGSKAWKLAKNILTGPNPVGSQYTGASATPTLTPATDSFSIAINDVDAGINTSTTITLTNVVVSGSAITTAASLVSAINSQLATTKPAGSSLYWSSFVQVSNDSAGRITFTFSGDLTLANVSGNPLAYMNIYLNIDGTYTPVFYNNSAYGTSASTTIATDQVPSQQSVELTFAPANNIPQGSTSGDVWVNTTTPLYGANYVVKNYASSTATWNTLTVNLYDNDTDAATALGSSLAAYSVYCEYNANPLNGYSTASFDLRLFTGSGWIDVDSASDPLTFEQSTTAPTTPPAQGTYWYSTDFQADIMYGTGENWVGYRTQFPNTDPNGPILSGSAPATQTDGTILVQNDLWIDTSDTENYPQIYRFVSAIQSWTLINNEDHTSPYGIVFADVRQDSGPAYGSQSVTYNYNSTAAADMAKSGYCDPDAPDPRTYPMGMLVFNTRYSTYNVKEWQPNWFLPGGYQTATNFTLATYNVGDTYFPAITTSDIGRWVTASGNDVTGVAYMGRKAQRQLVVEALASQLVSNQAIRSEIVYFNLIATPGYVELLSDMVTLNEDCKNVAFIVGDTPARLASDSTSINNWANNASNVATDGDDGLVTHNSYIGIYYPWGFTTNVDGTNVVCPPSTMALYTIAYNDQVAYPWFAPAGFTRGLVSNATSVGYLDSTNDDEYTTVILNQSQRDTLYQVAINPIAYIPNRGLVVYGQKTLDPISEATDRVNVVRLCCYLSYQLNQLALPFLFEQNDTQTQSAFGTALTRFLSGLVGLQALTDFGVVCDSSNNTPDIVDANELWADIYIQPTKSIEFIYLPVIIQNTGATIPTSGSSSSSTS